MLKATLRSAVLLALVAFGMAMTSVPSFAEVQNVKVGGDITVRGFHRENMDLDAGDGVLDDEDNFFMQTTALNVGADLTENVAANIRIANERDWNVDGAATGDFALSQAYISLKELFYAPLTVRIGQQPIVWGRGFVLGSNLLGSVVLGGGTDRHTAIAANEYTDFTAFDAIRATLDLANVGGLNLPVTADYVYIKGDENLIGADDDVTIQGINFSSRFDTANSEADIYYLNKRDKTDADAEPEHGAVSTWGIRGSAKPTDGSTVWGEVAYQHGTLGADLEGLRETGTDQQAWAVNLGTEFGFGDVATSPKIGGEWRFYSGKNIQGATVGGVLGWDPVAPGYFTTAIREFQTRTTVGGFYAPDQTGVTSAQTNQHELALFGSLVPMEDLTARTRMSWFIMDVGALPPGAAPKRKNFLGTEWDTQLVYDYTDDVQFGLLYALFLPGSVFRDAGDAGGPASRSTAQQIVTTVGVKF